MAQDESNLIQTGGNSAFGTSNFELNNSGYGHLLYLNHQWQAGQNLRITQIISFQKDLTKLESRWRDDASGGSRDETRDNFLNLARSRYGLRQFLEYDFSSGHVVFGWGAHLTPLKAMANLSLPPYYPVISGLNETDTVSYIEQFGEYLQKWRSWEFTAGVRMESDNFYRPFLVLSPRLGIHYQASRRIRVFAGWGIYRQFPSLEAMAFRSPPVNIFTYQSIQGRQATRFENHAEKIGKSEIGLRVQIDPSFSAHFAAFSAASNNLLGSEAGENLQSTYTNTRNGLAFSSKGVEFRAVFFRAHEETQVIAAFHNTRLNDGSGWESSATDFRWNFALFQKWQAAEWMELGAVVHFLRLDNFPELSYFQFGHSQSVSPVVYTSQAVVKRKFSNYLRFDLRVNFLIGSHTRFFMDAVNITNHRNYFDSAFFREQVHENQWRVVEEQIYNLPFLLSGGLEITL